MEENIEKANNKTYLIIIILLFLIILVLVGFIVYDKVLTTNENINTETTNIEVNNKVDGNISDTKIIINYEKHFE